MLLYIGLHRGQSRSDVISMSSNQRQVVVMSLSRSAVPVCWLCLQPTPRSTHMFTVVERNYVNLLCCAQVHILSNPTYTEYIHFILLNLSGYLLQIRSFYYSRQDTSMWNLRWLTVEGDSGDDNSVNYVLTLTCSSLYTQNSLYSYIKSLYTQNKYNAFLQLDKYIKQAS